VDWRPCANLETLRFRATFMANIRQFFHERAVLEVDTPILARHGVTDPALSNFTVQGAFGQRHLQTSPEYHMKRLLAAGSGSIYQIARAFRDEECGRKHQPEFALLEWYRVGFDHHQLMHEVETLIHSLAQDVIPCAASTHHTYQSLFQTYLNIDPFEHSIDTLRQISHAQGLHLVETDVAEDKDIWLDLLLSHCIEPQLGQHGLCFVTDYPVSQACLAKLSQTQPPVAERFEVYWQGIELANGFHELTDAQEQARRFAAEQQISQTLGLADRAVDHFLLAALSSGLPDCAGVALGLERLLMLLLQQSDIAQVIAFPEGNA